MCVRVCVYACVYDKKYPDIFIIIIIIIIMLLLFSYYWFCYKQFVIIHPPVYYYHLLDWFNNSTFCLAKYLLFFRSSFSYVYCLLLAIFSY